MFRRTALLFSAFLSCGLLNAQTADEVVSRVVNALGGAKHFAPIKTAKIQGTLTTPDGKVNPVTVQMKRPSMFRIDLEMGPNYVIQAFDGQAAWQSVGGEANSPAAPLTGSARDKVIDQAVNGIGGPLVEYKQRGTQVQLEGRQDISGKNCYKVKVTLKTGDVMYLYIDPATYQEVGEELVTKDGIIEETVGDFKKFGDIMMATHFASHMKGQTGDAVLEIKSMQFNMDLADSIFHMPQPAGK